MENFKIIIENKDQKSSLELTTSHNQRIIEETTTYFEDGKIFKISSTKEVYTNDLLLENLKLFFNNQLSNLIEF